MVNLTARDGSPLPQSADVFLYTRCAVVAAGRAVWESVFSDVASYSNSDGWPHLRTWDELPLDGDLVDDLANAAGTTMSAVSTGLPWSL